MLETKNLDILWDKLLELGISEQTLQTVTNINGYNETSFNDILYSNFGYRSFDQLEEMEEN